MTILTLTLPDDLHRELEAWAAETGQAPAAAVLDVLEKILEDREDLRIAQERWADIMAGRSYVIPLEDVLRDLDLDD